MMSEYQFDQSDVIIQNGDDTTVANQAQTLEKELEKKLSNNELSMWDMDSNNLVGDNFDNLLLTAGLGNQKIIFDSTVSYLAFGNNVKDQASDKPIEVYRDKPTVNQDITVLAGRKAGINYTANGESGTIINTTGKLIFHADTSTFIEANGNRKYLSKKNPSGKFVKIQQGNWTIVAGDADNEINFGVGNQTVNAGNGNNTINANNVNQNTDMTQLNQHITVGNGNNTINTIGNATITTGKGNDTINTAYAPTYNGDYHDVDYTKINQQIDAGDGDNSIVTAGNVTITAGSGNDNIISTQYNYAYYNEINYALYNQQIDAGEGDNTITALGNATILSGNGKDIIDTNNSDKIVFSSKTDFSKLYSQIITKNGDKSITFGSNVEITAGNGSHQIHQTKHNDSIDPQFNKITSQIHLGDGKVGIDIDHGISTITAGSGGGYINNAYGYMDLTVGDGNYNISDKGDLYGYSSGHDIIQTGNGNNYIRFSKGGRGKNENNITTGNGNDNIDIYGSQNTIHAGLGNNTITLTASEDGIGENNIYTDVGSFNKIQVTGGDNNIYSLGQDTINSADNTQDYQTNVTLLGSHSEVHVNNSIIYDFGNYNQITTNFSSTVTGGNNSVIQFTNKTDNSSIPNSGHDNLFLGGKNDTISATEGSDLKAVRGSNNQFTVDGNFTFTDGTGNNTATVNGNVDIKGSNSLNLTLNAKGAGDNVFHAGNGNETLNGTQSQAALRIYANQTEQKYYTNFVASTGTGDDILYAGTGNSTFSGGLGNNTFVFDKNNIWYGTNTVITDFSVSKGNKIGLYNFGLNQSSLDVLLHNSVSDSHGDTVLMINNGGNTLTLQGVSKSDLHSEQFILTPPNHDAITV